MDNLLYYDDIKVGSRNLGGSVTVDHAEMLAFAKIWDPLPIHTDPISANQVMGGLTAPGLYILALKQRLLHDLPQKTVVIASFGYDEVRFLKPVFAGDSLTLAIDWTEKRLSTSRPDQGIVTHRLSLENDDGQAVMSHLDTILVRRRTKL